MTRRKGRILAVQALFAWDMSGGEAGEEFAWRDSPKPDDDLSFARLLFWGAREHLAEIDGAISRHLSKRSLERINKVDLAVLRMSAYTLLYQKDMHPSIVIDEAVDIAKAFSTDDGYKFVNAVLDGIRKEGA